MKKPNFFLIGAPKCGTTSMANWLGVHPQVFMSNPKEPRFFNSDVGLQWCTDLKSYEALFRDANEKHLIVGEATTNYLWSRTAVPAILDYSPDARFLVMLRKPQEMVVSLHAQECRGLEDQPDFETAWRLQPQRAQGRMLPPHCRAPSIYQYGERCRVGTQLKRLFEIVSRDRVLIVFLEDMRRSPLAEYRRVLKFLGLKDFQPSALNALNPRREVRSFKFKKILNSLGAFKTKLGIKRSTGILAPFYRLNTKPGGYQGISEALRKELDEYFLPEILLVRDLLGRVPEQWLS